MLFKKLRKKRLLLTLISSDFFSPINCFKATYFVPSLDVHDPLHNIKIQILAKTKTLIKRSKWEKRFHFLREKEREREKSLGYRETAYLNTKQ